MKRSLILGVLLSAGTLTIGMAAQQAQPRVIEVEKLKDNLYVLKGGGGNTAVFIMTDGVAVVDAKNPGWGQPILDKIKTLTNKPVTTLINTHTHGDHVSGNVEFPASVDIVVQENTAANMKKMIPNSTAADQKVPAKTIFDEHNGQGLPKHTFKDRMTLFKGADEIDLYYFGRGHTNGDTFVVFPALRTMHVGDIFAWKALPYVDTANGGSVVEQPDTLAKAVATVKNVDTLINGHIPVSTWNDLRDYADFTREFVDLARASMKAGKTAEQAAGEFKVAPRFKGYTVSINAIAGPAANMKIAYDELQKK